VSYPFFIWTLQRTGGTSLADLLMKMSEHKSAEHEPFNLRRQFGHITRRWDETKNDSETVDAVAKVFADRYLIKHCYDLHGMAFNVLLARAALPTDYRHIILLRRDERSRVVSKLIAEANGTWFKDYARKVYDQIAQGERALKPLPADRAVAYFTHCRDKTMKLRRRMRQFGLKPLQIFYEDLYVGERKQRLAHLDGLFDFLGFTPGDIAAHAVEIEDKIFGGGQNTADIIQFVPNLDEVETALAAAGLRKPPTAAGAAGR
jgi:hypothetical protein